MRIKKINMQIINKKSNNKNMIYWKKIKLVKNINAMKKIYIKNRRKQSRIIKQNKF